MIESCIFCEGYHDRAFWGGLLASLGCTDPGSTAAGPRIPVLDPWGLAVRGSGEHAYRSKSGAFIRLVPVGGKANVLEFAERRLRNRDQKPLTRLVVSIDSDCHADGTPNATSVISAASVLAMARRVDPSASDAGATVILTDATIDLVQWTAPEPPAPGLPNQHCLERLISAAIVAAYPPRSAPVQQWLDSRPAPPPPCAKEHAWSYMAGWYADSGGYEAFCTRLWSDRGIAEHLVSRLTATGVWQVAQLLAA